MDCSKCGGLVAAKKELSNTKTQRRVVSQCVKCKQYYEIKQTREVITEVPSAFCKHCGEITPYKAYKDLMNWGAYERGEEEPKEYEIKVCMICNK